MQGFICRVPWHNFPTDIIKPYELEHTPPTCQGKMDLKAEVENGHSF